MKTNANLTEPPAPVLSETNIVPLGVHKRRQRLENYIASKFKITPFSNRAGSAAWRVSGTKRDGSRVRDNFAELQAAQCRQVELEAEFHARQTDTAVRATRLSETELRLAETAFLKLDAPDEILPAVDLWIRQGKALAVKASPRLDEAVEQFKAWLLTTEEMRDHSKRNLRIRIDMFANGVSNIILSTITPEFLEAYLDKRNVSGATKDNDRRAVSRFFAWCIERPRRWMTTNPARDVKVERGEKPPPSILTVDQCKKLLHAAETFNKGRLAPYVAVCLFAGLRPSEAGRLQWEQVNLKDGEIRLEANQTKTGCPRVVTINPTLKAWLEKYSGKEFYPANWRKHFDEVKKRAGFGTPDETDPKRKKLVPWPDDVMRHTAISHYFRNSGSYGLTAEQFGNSEAIIKKHYQGRVSTDDAKTFYAILPSEKGTK